MYNMEKYYIFEIARWLLIYFNSLTVCVQSTRWLNLPLFDGIHSISVHWTS